ncbi:hydrogen peroxide-inducible genes activator [Conexibacter arvalis]|uniref:Probable hydrogen peroxide-inducible genes activator n=1 Tax=Conexibacter arvalis TaxID=912552 RepID=A0A840IJP8_9ACTN|nr:hydrogen peroxide-inducible genes activator [Conexibacter arvalis]MBB4664383.1 LysR family hydrogen peroxide-inducible transcriptional activator [Conexibacter arvalis]
MTDRTAQISRKHGRSAPTLAQLRAFVAVCEMRHFGRAAERLGIGQSTLSQAVAALEANAGAQLVERSTRHVVVTAVGRRLLAHARAAVAAADAFAEEAAGAGGLLSGPLRLGLIPTVAPYLLPALLSCAAREAPELELAVHEEQTEPLVAALRAGEVDAAVLALPLEESDLRELPLYDEELVVLVPSGHAWAGQTGLAPEAVGEAGLLLLEPGHCLRDQTLALCGEQAAARGAGAAANAISLPTIVQLVAGGLGVTVVPATALRVEARRARVATARLAGDPPPRRRVGLAWRASSAREEQYAELAALLRRGVRSARLPVRAAR